MKTTKVPKIMLYSSAPKRAADSRISETTTHNSSSPAFKRRSKLPILKVLLLDAAAVGTTLVGAAAVEDGTAAAVWATLVAGAVCTTKRKRDDDPMEGIYESMKNLGTKRFLLGLHYMNTNAPTREITFQATTGDIIFGKYL